MLRTSRMYHVGKVATRVSSNNDGMMEIVYHNTVVVRFNEKIIELHTGGWRTATTKTRMNQASNVFGLGFHVWQKDYEWYVSFKGQEILMEGQTLKLDR